MTTERVQIELSGLFWRVTHDVRLHGGAEHPSRAGTLRKEGFKFDIMQTSFFVSRRSIRPSLHGGMPFWQDKLFISLAKSATDATDFFQIPTGRVVEVGTQVTV